MIGRRSAFVMVAAAASLLLGSAVAQAATPAKDYIAGEDNPMCIKMFDEQGNKGKDCLRVSDTTVVAGSPVTFTGRFGFDPQPGQKWCLARSPEAYGDYQGINACSTVNKDGTLTIVAYLGKPGTAYYDLGIPACLALAPKDRPPRACGDDGGVASMPVKVTVAWS